MAILWSPLASLIAIVVAWLLATILLLSQQDFVSPNLTLHNAPEFSLLTYPAWMICQLGRYGFYILLLLEGGAIAIQAVQIATKPFRINGLFGTVVRLKDYIVWAERYILAFPYIIISVSFLIGLGMLRGLINSAREILKGLIGYQDQVEPQQNHSSGTPPSYKWINGNGPIFGFFSGQPKPILFPKELHQILRNLREHNTAATQPFALVRNYLGKFTPRTGSPEFERWGMGHFQNSVAVAGLLHLLGAKLEFKASSEEFFRDYITSPELEKDQFRNGNDISLRFRNWSPELHFMRGNHDTNAVIPAYVALSCIRNPIRDPVYILPLQYIVEVMPLIIQEFDWVQSHGDLSGFKVALSGKVMEDALAERDRLLALSASGSITLKYFDNYGFYQTGIQNANVHPPIMNVSPTDNPDWQIAWDTNRTIFPLETEEPDTRKFGTVIKLSIERASNFASEITLEPGDVLLVDNRRALVRRREYDYRHVKAPHLRPDTFYMLPKRWLRVFYGFSKK